MENCDGNLRKAKWPCNRKCLFRLTALQSPALCLARNNTEISVTFWPARAELLPRFFSNLLPRSYYQGLISQWHVAVDSDLIFIIGLSHQWPQISRDDSVARVWLMNSVNSICTFLLQAQMANEVTQLSETCHPIRKLQFDSTKALKKYNSCSNEELVRLKVHCQWHCHSSSYETSV